MDEPIVQKRKYVAITGDGFALTFDAPNEANNMSFDGESFVIDMENHMLIVDGQPKPISQYKP